MKEDTTEKVDVPAEEHGIRVKYMGQWTERMSFQYFQDHYSERFPQVEALEVNQMLTRDEFESLYPEVIITNHIEKL
jgi:hypothetical protein